MSEQTESVFLRDDVHELSQEMDTSNFNIRKFKQRKMAKTIKHLTTERISSSIFRKIRTEQLDSTQLATGEAQPQRVNSSNFDQLMKVHDTFIPPHSRRQPSNKIKSFSQPKGFSSTEKEFNRGKLKTKNLQNWLNNILIEYCSEEYFDKNIANSALKKFSIDQNSLQAKGVKPEDIPRLYNAFFVYGIGFNNFLKEVTHGKEQLMKNIWKIYALMLEYCADGSHETLIGNIERDKVQKIVELQNEIEKKQQIIQKNEELNETKNDQIYKDIKRLKEENINLSNEKGVLQQEYQLTDQAFNEEVNLRLKFQSKINEIYGLHRELGIKHHKLHDDLMKRMEELRRISEKHSQITQKAREYREQLLEVRENYAVLQRSTANADQHRDSLRAEVSDLHSQLAEAWRQLSLYKSVAEEKEMKMEQYTIDMQNMMAMMELRQKSAKETHNEYQITLEENNRLYLSLSDQRRTMEAYEAGKKDFNSKVIRILSQCSFYKKKMEEALRRCDELEKRHQVDLQNVNRVELAEKVYEGRINSLEMDLKSNYDNIEKMHKRNFELEGELQYLRKFERNLGSLIADKDAFISVCTQNQRQSTETIDRLNAEVSTLLSKINMLELQLRAERDTNQRIYDRLTSEKNTLQASDHATYSLLKLSESQVQRYRHLFSESMTDLKNEKFERNTLNTNYIQSLRIIEKKNGDIRLLQQSISSLKEQVHESRGKHQLIEVNMFKLVSDYGLIQEKLEKVLMSQKGILDRKYNHVHPMIYEDLLMGYDREVKLRVALQVKAEHTEEKLSMEVDLLTCQMQRLKEYHQQDSAKMATQAEIKYQALLTQIKYEQDRNQQLSVKLKTLEELASSYKKKIQERTTSERQEIYRITLEEKKKQIEHIMAQLETTQDQLILAQRTINETATHLQLQEGTAEKKENDSKLIEQTRAELNEKHLETIRRLEAELAGRKQKQRESKEEIVGSLSIEDLLRMKGIEIDCAIKQLAQKSKQFKNIENQKRSTTYLSRDRNRVVSEDARKREQVARRLKNAYDYYN